MFGLIKKYFFYKKNIKIIGKQVSIKRGTIYQPHKLIVNDYVHIGPGYFIHAGGGIEIGKGTIIGPKVKIWTVNHEYNNFELLPYTENVLEGPVQIGRGCWIGLNVMICPNVNIGDGVVIAMGTVVTKNIPDFAIVGGNPAKILKYRYNNENELSALKSIIFNERFYGEKKFKKI